MPQAAQALPLKYFPVGQLHTPADNVAVESVHVKHVVVLVHDEQPVAHATHVLPLKNFPVGQVQPPPEIVAVES